MLIIPKITQNNKLNKQSKLTRYPEAESIINTFFNNPNNHTKLNFKKLNNSQKQYEKSEFIDQNEEILQDITKEITKQISQKNLEINNRVHLFIQLQVLNKAYDLTKSKQSIDKNFNNFKPIKSYLIIN